jgi:hypothetical protein
MTSWVNSEQFQKVVQWFLVVLDLISGLTNPAWTADITSNKDAQDEGVTGKLFPAALSLSQVPTVQHAFVDE